MDGPDLILPGAVNPYPFNETVPWWGGMSSNSVGVANNLIAAEAPCLPQPITINYLICDVATTEAGKNVRLGAWTYDGTTWTLAAYTASTPVAASGSKQKIAVVAPTVIPGGVRRFYGLSCDGTTAAFSRPSAGLTRIYDDAHSAILKASSFDFPNQAASFTAADLGATLAQVFWVRASAA